ncbi:MAG: hypothetical protein ACFCVD_16040 [Nodosilinea sp.]
MIQLRYLAFATTAVAITATTLAAAPASAQDRSLWLYSGESATVEGYLTAGEAVYGSCDEDCMDMDLFLFDANTGDLVYEDSAVDSAPVVVAPWEGNFVMQVTMPNCTHPDGCAAWVSSDYGF